MRTGLRLEKCLAVIPEKTFLLRVHHSPMLGPEIADRYRTPHRSCHSQDEEIA